MTKSPYTAPRVALIVKLERKKWHTIVCSCRHSKWSAYVRSMYCVQNMWDCMEEWQSCTKTICTQLAGR